MLRKNIIYNYLQDQEIYTIIGHDMLVYIKIVGMYLSMLAIVFALYFWLSQYVVTWQTLQRIVTWLGIIIYAKGLYDIADEYLDSLVISNKWLILFRRNGVFNYSTTYLQWVSIETISEAQHTLRDSLFQKGHLKIKLEDEKYIFKDVSQPSKKVSLLLNWKEKILWRYQYHENETPLEAEPWHKYEILIEALWEVVSEYVEKKKQIPQI